MTRHILYLAMGSLLAACSAEQPPAARDVREPAAAPAVVAEPGPTPSPSPAPARREFVLAVDGEGLRLIDPDSGAARPLAFGAPAAQVLEALERQRGPAARGTNADCGLDYANWADGLSLRLRDGRFVGWALDKRAEGAITTMSGIGPGLTRAEIESAYADLKLEKTTLGDEFTAGGLSGVLDGAAADARVENLWAGEPCVFR